MDTGFLVSLYSPDGNSAAAIRILRAAAGTFFITTFAELEVINALGLRVFRKEVSSSQAQLSLENFEQDMRTDIFRLKPLPENVFLRARQISGQTTARLGTRTADLLHIAAALELSSEGFYTFDRQQRKLAQAMRLKVNPLS